MFAGGEPIASEGAAAHARQGRAAASQWWAAGPAAAVQPKDRGGPQRRGAARRPGVKDAASRAGMSWQPGACARAVMLSQTLNTPCASWHRTWSGLRPAHDSCYEEQAANAACVRVLSAMFVSLCNLDASCMSCHYSIAYRRVNDDVKIPCRVKEVCGKATAH